jgi:hypothetical protein
LIVLTVTGLLAGVGIPRLASAQQDVAAARSCTSISNDVARLACYDQAFGVEEPDSAARRVAPNGSAGNAGNAGSAGRAADTGNANASRTPPPVVERQIPAPRSAPGSSQRAPADESADFEVTIVEVRRYNRINDVTFVTDDGQSWRQTDGRRIRLPDPPFRAVISEGALGSHFLSPAGRPGSVRVTQQH